MEAFNSKKIFIILLSLINLFSFTSEIKTLRVIEEEENDQEEKTFIKPPGFSRISGFYHIILKNIL